MGEVIRLVLKRKVGSNDLEMVMGTYNSIKVLIENKNYCELQNVLEDYYYRDLSIVDAVKLARKLETEEKIAEWFLDLDLNVLIEMSYLSDRYKRVS